MSKLFNEMAVFEDSAHEAVMGVWWVGRLLRKTAARFFAGTLASDAQFNVLMTLRYAERPLTQRDLSERLFVDKSNVTGLAGRMEAAGLIVRDPDPDDARALRLSLTPAGRKALDRIEPAYREHLAALTADFTPEELKALTGFMMRLQKALDRKDAER